METSLNSQTQDVSSPAPVNTDTALYLSVMDGASKLHNRISDLKTELVQSAKTLTECQDKLQRTETEFAQEKANFVAELAKCRQEKEELSKELQNTKDDRENVKNQLQSHQSVNSQVTKELQNEIRGREKIMQTVRYIKRECRAKTQYLNGPSTPLKSSLDHSVEAELNDCLTSFKIFCETLHKKLEASTELHNEISTFCQQAKELSATENHPSISQVSTTATASDLQNQIGDPSSMPNNLAETEETSQEEAEVIDVVGTPSSTPGLHVRCPSIPVAEEIQHTDSESVLEEADTNSAEQSPDQIYELQNEKSSKKRAFTGNKQNQKIKRTKPEMRKNTPAIMTGPSFNISKFHHPKITPDKRYPVVIIERCTEASSRSSVSNSPLRPNNQDIINQPSLPGLDNIPLTVSTYCPISVKDIYHPDHAYAWDKSKQSSGIYCTCGFVVNSVTALKMHIQFFGDGYRFRCDVEACGKTNLEDIAQNNKHCRQKHKELWLGRQKDYAERTGCQKCGVIFASMSEFDKHLGNFGLEANNVCPMVFLMNV